MPTQIRDHNSGALIFHQSAIDEYTNIERKKVKNLEKKIKEQDILIKEILEKMNQLTGEK